MSLPAVHGRDGGSQIKVRAAPGARTERIVGVHGDALKIAVQAPPERGRANDRLLAVLAKALGVPVRTLAITAGATGRDKLVRIEDLAPAEVLARLGLAR